MDEEGEEEEELEEEKEKKEKKKPKPKLKEKQAKAFGGENDFANLEVPAIEPNADAPVMPPSGLNSLFFFFCSPPSLLLSAFLDPNATLYHLENILRSFSKWLVGEFRSKIFVQLYNFFYRHVFYQPSPSRNPETIRYLHHVFNETEPSFFRDGTLIDDSEAILDYFISIFEVSPNWITLDYPFLFSFYSLVFQ